MLKKYGIDDSKLFKVVVVATMSSGKSTFINALIGQDILSTQNQACTARTIQILDNDKLSTYRAYVEYNDGKNLIVDLKNRDIIDSFNNDDTIKDILIEGNIKRIRNRNRAVVLIDTPGTNFSGDDTHQKETYKFISTLEDGLILYVINATQFGVNDDFKLMTHIKERIESSNKKLKILFVVNKIDEFDVEKESVQEAMNSIYKYIVSNGIENPTIIPISALAAKLFRQGINGEKLTRKEIREFKDYFDLFKSNDYNLSKFSKIDSIEKKHVDIGGESFYEDDLLSAIDNTGIILVEKIIEDLLVDETSTYIPKVNFYVNQNNSYIDDIIHELLKVYNDIEVFDEVIELKSYIENRNINYSAYEKIQKTYDEAHLKSKEIMLKYDINKGENYYEVPKIIKNAIKGIKRIIKEDSNIIFNI
ncbi:dynamin family protein [Clostridium vincentii]|uniref:GTPase Era n=1 Tax=Clostridium vincentii TaxID=52704 RepID=A0A2T0BDM4_9CLOT|nr:dynamin family protein [Clostridium vincentii]PRR81998.1 GTPase Era [Clostridium vincentii]